MKTIRLTSRADFAPLSYYTLSRMADALHLVYPWALVEAGRETLILTTDDLGNFVGVERVPSLATVEG